MKCSEKRDHDHFCFGSKDFWTSEELFGRIQFAVSLVLYKLNQGLLLLKLRETGNKILVTSCTLQYYLSVSLGSVF